MVNKLTRLIKLRVTYSYCGQDKHKTVVVSSDTKAVNMLSAATSALARQFNVQSPANLRITRFIGSQVAV